MQIKSSLLHSLCIRPGQIQFYHARPVCPIRHGKDGRSKSKRMSGQEITGNIGFSFLLPKQGLLFHFQCIICPSKVFVRRHLQFQVSFGMLFDTAKITVISPNFLVWEFCEKTQFPHIFGRIAGNSAEAALSTKSPYQKIR